MPSSLPRVIFNNKMANFVAIVATILAAVPQPLLAAYAGKNLLTFNY